MKRLIAQISARIACIVPLLFGVLPPAAAADELVLGIFPFLSTRQMVDQFGPLKEHLSRAVGQPVTLRSAPDYKRFIERTAAGEYDVIIDAPHLARLAQKRDGYRPLAQSGYQVEFMVVARKDSPVQTLADLRGRAVAVGARLSLTHMLLGKELLKSGLVLDRDVVYLDTATFSNVLHAVLHGDAAVGALTALVWNGASPEIRGELREILRQKDLGPGLIVLAHPRLGATVQRKLQTALYAFKDTEEGQAYFQKTKQIDFRPVSEADMRVMDPYTELLVRP